MSFTVRPGRADDLSTIHAIWYANEVAADPSPPASGPILSGFSYEMERGDLRVAEDEAGRTLGFGATVGWGAGRDALTYLADLFIADDAQSQGVGQALLRALPLGDGVPRCVHASVDPRATALYIRWGMEPRWPNYLLAADPQWDAHGLAVLPGADLEVVAAAPDDPDLAAWDLRHFGHPRARDLAWLVESRDAQPLWFRRAGRTLGYGYVQRRCDEALWSPQAWTVGPVGAETPADARDCV
ncbi:MAG TPA: GNAT family N-acetyltransferase, partial [Ktedonobacterales bacterium]